MCTDVTSNGLASLASLFGIGWRITKSIGSAYEHVGKEAGGCVHINLSIRHALTGGPGHKARYYC